MSTSSSTSNDIQAKIINATSKVVPMHLQIKALKKLDEGEAEDHWHFPPSGALC
jgi:hypothetical protein